MIRTATIILLLITPLVAATTIHVPYDYPQIQEAIDAASGGDTVLVAPKTYRVSLNFGGKDIILLSEAGPRLTVLTPRVFNQSMLTLGNGEGPGAKVSGFTFLGGTAHGTAISIQNSSPTIEQNYFMYHHSYAGGQPQIYIRDSGSPTIRKNLFVNDDSLRMAIWLWGTDPTYINNNTFYGGDRGIFSWSPQLVARNNIVVGLNTGISTNTNIIEDHNNAWGNASDYVGFTPDPTSLSVDPLFVDPDGLVFLLSPGSPCINSGNPNPIYNDPDGTVGDMGAFPFDTHVPSAYNLGVAGEDVGHVLTHSPEFYWSFYGIEQEGFLIEVGTDNDWSTAEAWSYGSGLTTDTSVVYAGIPLQDSVTYYYRLRVMDSASVSNWIESVFRMNSPSFTPAAYWPTGGELLSVKAVQLFAANPNESEGDSLFFDFEIYSDPGLTNLVASRTGIPERPDTTGSGYVDGLPDGQTYYWRCRTFDKFEYSDWSSAASFEVRAGTVLNVPTIYTTIQAGIDAAQQGDTVLVADGIYSGDGNRDLTFYGKNITLKSVSGPGATSIIVGGSETDTHRAISFENGEDSTSIVEGFTMGYGFVDVAVVFAGYYSGGVTLKNCIITQSSSYGLFTNGWQKPITIDSCRFTGNGSSGAYLFSPATIRNSVFDHNNAYGLMIGGWNLVDISNCTFVANVYDGFVVEGEPPLGRDDQAAAEDSNRVYNSIAAYNGGCGFGQIFWSRPIALSCNNAFGNLGYDEFCVGLLEPGVNGNISEHPYFCDTASGDYHISDQSPCAPANNDCGLLMGTFDVNCVGCCVARGDFNHSGGDTPIDISDITAFVAYLFGGGTGPLCPEEGDANGNGQTDITDLTVIVDYAFNGGAEPPPCPAKPGGTRMIDKHAN